MSIPSFRRTVQKDWNLTPLRSKLARARRLILHTIHGDEVHQYNSLWDYGHELRKSNHGSSFYLNLAGNLFSSCYMSLDACKRGFLAACRPIICLDGCHIKTKFGGQLLTTVGMDPNDRIYPIAMAVVEVESLASQKWFLQTLKNDLQIENTQPWTFMTNKQKVRKSQCCCLNTFFGLTNTSCFFFTAQGLLPAVKQVFSESEHRFCVRHLYANFQEKFKSEILKKQLWACATSSSETQFNIMMGRMKELNLDAWKWLDKMPPNTWVRAYFSEFPKSDIFVK